MEVIAGEDEFEVTVLDLVRLVKSEGIYLELSPEGDLRIHPGKNEPREDVIDVITENADSLIDWLMANEYWDS